LTFTRVHTLPFTDRAYKYAGIMNKRCGTAGKLRRKCGTRIVLIFKGFLPVLEFDMRSRGIRLPKEDSMVVEGPILTVNSHGEKFSCNRLPHKVRSL